MARKEAEVANPCRFCLETNDDEKDNGRLITNGKISAHEYCLYFASGLGQRWEPEAKKGLLGFHPDDIEKELKRGSRLKCVFCKKPGATIGCNVKQCRKMFHFPCGRRHHTLNQYTDNFHSYCNEHRTDQPPPTRADIKRWTKETGEVTCVICLDDVDTNSPEGETLYPPCCKGGIMHKDCLINLGLSSGAYHIKCPCCFNSEKFKKDMKLLGINVPERDASWELQNQFEELDRGHHMCSAETCICPEGRYHDKWEGPWYIEPCYTCNGSFSHICCAGLKDRRTKYFCDVCKPDPANPKPKMKKKGKKKVGVAAAVSRSGVQEDAGPSGSSPKRLKSSTGISPATTPRRGCDSVALGTDQPTPSRTGRSPGQAKKTPCKTPQSPGRSPVKSQKKKKRMFHPEIDSNNNTGTSAEQEAKRIRLVKMYLSDWRRRKAAAEADSEVLELRRVVHKGDNEIHFFTASNRKQEDAPEQYDVHIEVKE